jgi:energy-coupling factor transporter ATP-binding protein EcfA2
MGGGTATAVERDLVVEPGASAGLLKMRDQGLTLLLTDHLLTLLEAVADRLLALDRGEIIAQGRLHLDSHLEGCLVPVSSVSLIPGDA